MGRKRRSQAEESIYFISNRCFQGRYLLAPNQSGKINSIFIECLAIAQERYKVIIYGYVVMSNHYHLVVKAPLLNLSPFMRDFQTQFSKRINGVRERRGTLFPERFSCELIKDNMSLFTVVRYIVLNPVRAKLVSSPYLWPGAISLPKDGKPPALLSPFPKSKSRIKTLDDLWKALDKSIEKALRVEPECQGPFKGVDVVLETNPFDAAPPPKRKRRSLYDKIFAKNDAAKEALTQEEEQIQCKYDSAFENFGLSLLAAFLLNPKYPKGLSPPPIISPPDALPFLLAHSGVERSELQSFVL